MSLNASSITTNNTKTAVAVVAASVLLSIAIFQTNNKRKSNHRLPPWAPISRFAFYQVVRSGKILSALSEWAEQLGYPSAYRISLLPGRTTNIVVDPMLCREILADKTSRKTDRIYRAIATVIGTNIFTETDQVKWKVRRKGVAPAFSSNHIHRMNQICMDHIDRWIKERLEPMIEKDEAFDPSEEMIKLTISVICKAAFDQEPTDEDTERFILETDLVFKEGTRRYQFPGWMMMKNYFEVSRRAEEAAMWMKEFGRKFLMNHRANPNPFQGTVIDCINKNPHYKDDEERICDITFMVSAGFDTTAYTLAWTMFALAEHPKEHDKLLSEFAKIPKAEWPTSTALQNVIRESMRLNPVAAGGTSRITGRDFISKEGLIIPKGSIASMCVLSLHRNPNIFEHPNEFLPDRWNEADENMNRTFMPFMYGPRNCVGQGLATAEINSVLAKLAGQYRFESVKEYTPAYFITYKPKGGLIKARRV